MATTLKVKIDPNLVLLMLIKRGKQFITVDELARLLGTSTYSAGRILSSLAKEGKITKWSRRTYKIPLGRITYIGEDHEEASQINIGNS